VFAATLAVALTGFSAAALAQNPPPDARGGPPPEALAACKSAKPGDACSFNGGRGAASGTCWAPEGKPLACKPKDAPTPKKP